MTNAEIYDVMTIGKADLFMNVFDVEDAVFQYKFNGRSLSEDVSHGMKTMSMLEKITSLTILSTGSFVESINGLNFMMPSTKDCIKNWKEIRKRLNKKRPIYISIFTWDPDHQNGGENIYVRIK